MIRKKRKDSENIHPRNQSSLIGDDVQSFVKERYPNQRCAHGSTISCEFLPSRGPDIIRGYGITGSEDETTVD